MESGVGNLVDVAGLLEHYLVVVHHHVILSELLFENELDFVPLQIGEDIPTQFDLLLLCVVAVYVVVLVERAARIVVKLAVQMALTEAVVGHVCASFWVVAEHLVLSEELLGDEALVLSQRHGRAILNEEFV